MVRYQLSVCKLTNLKKLLLSSNRLIGKLPNEISNLKELQVLSVFDNNFFGTIPAIYWRFSKS